MAKPLNFDKNSVKSLKFSIFINSFRYSALSIDNIASSKSILILSIPILVMSGSLLSFEAEITEI